MKKKCIALLLFSCFLLGAGSFTVRADAKLPSASLTENSLSKTLTEKKVEKAKKQSQKRSQKVTQAKEVTLKDENGQTLKDITGQNALQNPIDGSKSVADIAEDLKSENESLSKTVAEVSNNGSQYENLPLTYASFKNHLDRFTSKVWFGNDVVGMKTETLYLINSFVQAIFWLNKMIFQIGAQIYEFLATDVVGAYFDDILNAAAAMFNQFKASLLPVVGISMATYLAYLYFVRNESFFKNLLKLLILFGLSTSFFMKNANGQYLIQRFYENTRDVTSELATMAVSSTDDLTKDGLSSETTSAVLDQYFLNAIWTPYQLMNSDKGTNQDDKNGFKLSDKQLKQLLAYDSGDDAFELGDSKKTLKDIAGERKSPKNKMLKDAWGEKFAYAIVSTLDTFLMGFVIDAFAIVSFVLQFMILLLILVSPFALILSLFPTLENVLFNFLKALGGTIIVSGLMTFASVIFLFFYDVLRTTTMSIFENNLILAVVVNYLVIWIIYRKRHQLLSILTANRVTSLNNRLTETLSGAGRQFKKQSLDRVRNNALSKLALAGVMTRGAYKLGRRKAFSGARHAVSNMKQSRQKISAETKANRSKRKGGSYEQALLLARNKQIERSAKYAGMRHRIGRTRALVGALASNLQAEYYSGTDRESHYREKAQRRLAVADREKQNQMKQHQMRKSARQQINRIQKPRQNITSVPKFQVNQGLTQDSLQRVKEGVLKRPTTSARTRRPVSLDKEFSKLEPSRK